MRSALAVMNPFNAKTVLFKEFFPLYLLHSFVKFACINYS